MDWLKNITGTLEDVGVSAGNIYKAFQSNGTPPAPAVVATATTAKSTLPSWIMPAAIVGGLLALFLIFRKA